MREKKRERVTNYIDDELGLIENEKKKNEKNMNSILLLVD